MLARSATFTFITVDVGERLRAVSRNPLPQQPTVPQLTAATRQITARVRNDWEAIAPEDKAILVRLAYAVIEPPKTRPRLRDIWAYVSRYMFASKQAKNDRLVLVRAANELVEAVLDAVERTNPVLQGELKSHLQRAIEEIENGSAEFESFEDFRAWTKSHIR